MAKRVWIPLVILVVLTAGAMTVSRLHGIFGSEEPVRYGETSQGASKPFNPKYMRYEIFGPPGTLADISYFDVDGNPVNASGVTLPWSLEFPIYAAAGVGSVAAVGDRESIGCRVLIDGVVQDEDFATHEVSTFISCMLKAA